MYSERIASVYVPREDVMSGIIYHVGLIMIIMANLSFLGLR